jgi:hypothetical protein
LNTLLNKLNNVIPEMHLPGYNYCGTSTQLNEILTRGDAPVNKLHARCQNHDFFTVNTEIQQKDILPIKKLADIDNERMHANDASVGERVSSALIKAIMNSKIAFGMGPN